MSTSVVRGRIENFSPKPSEDYYGVLISEEKGENWYNGQGEIPDDLSKGQKVKLKVNKDRFCEIDEINVMESGANEDDASRGSDVTDQEEDSSIGGSTGSNNSYVPTALQCALKEAAETARKQDLDTETHVDLVEELTKEYYRVLKENGEVQE